MGAQIVPSVCMSNPSPYSCGLM